MEPLIERYYTMVREESGDPHTSVRTSKANLLEEFHDTDQELFNALLGSTMQESMLGFAVATITLQDGVNFYRLPPGFRQFVEMGFRQTSGNTEYSAYVLRSGTIYDPQYTPEIVTGSKGFRLDPAPSLSSDQEWTLFYLRSPGRIHYAKTPSLKAKSLVAGQPPEGGGELVLVDNYYNGMELRIYQAGNNAAPQINWITDFKVSKEGGTFFLRYDWETTPSGDVWYEIVPTVPLEYDQIYALDMAMKLMDRRSRPDRYANLELRRKRLWSAIKTYVTSNVCDRGPSRLAPLQPMDFMPSGEVPY